MRRLLLVLTAMLPVAAYAQSPGTVRLYGPSTMPGAPQIKPDAVQNAVNQALTSKVDTNGGVATGLTVNGGTILGSTFPGTILPSPTITNGTANGLSLTGGEIGQALATVWTGFTPRTVQARGQDTYNPLDFGAKCDGTTDDTAALQNLVATANSASGNVNVVLPRGRCQTTQTLTFNLHAGQDLSIGGRGHSVSSIDYNGQTDGIAINYSDPKFNTVYLHDFRMYLNTSHLVLTSASAQTAQTAGVTTLTASAASGASTLQVADATGLVAGDDLVGMSCVLPVAEQVTTITGTTLTLSIPLTASVANACSIMFGTNRITVTDPGNTAALITQEAAAAAATRVTDQPFLGERVVAMPPSGPYTGSTIPGCPVGRPFEVVAVQGNTIVFNAPILSSAAAGCTFEVGYSSGTGIAINGQSYQQEAVTPGLNVTIDNVLLTGSQAGLFFGQASWLKGISIRNASNTHVHNTTVEGWTQMGYGVGYAGSSSSDGSGNPSGHTLADAHYLDTFRAYGIGIGIYSNSPYVEGIAAHHADMAGVGIGFYWSNAGYTDQMMLTDSQIASRYNQVDVVDVQSPVVSNNYFIADSVNSNVTQNVFAPPGSLVSANENASISFGNTSNATYSGNSIAFHKSAIGPYSALRECAFSTGGGQTNEGDTISNNSVQTSGFPVAYFYCNHGGGGRLLTGNHIAQGFGGTSGPILGLMGYDSVVGFVSDVQIGNGIGTSYPLNNVCSNNSVNGKKQWDCLGHFTPRSELNAADLTRTNSTINGYLDVYIWDFSTDESVPVVNGVVSGHPIVTKNLSPTSAITLTPTVHASTTATGSTTNSQTTVIVASTTGMVVGDSVDSNCPLGPGTVITSITDATDFVISMPPPSGITSGCTISTGLGEIDNSLSPVVLAAKAGTTIWWNDTLNTWLQK